MRELNDNEVWDRVQQLQGKTIFTLVRKKPNFIKEVTGNAVVIDGRRSRPTRSQIVYAYRHLWKHGELRPKEGNWKDPIFIWSIVPAILLAAIPEQFAKVGDLGLSGIHIKKQSRL